MKRPSTQRQRIGPAVRRLRRQQGLTLDALAMTAEVSPSHLSRLERSQTLPSFPVLAKIAEALGADVNELVRLEHDVAQLDAELEGYLDMLGIAAEQRAEILHLSIETRRDLTGRLRALAEDRLTPLALQDTIARVLCQPGGLPGLAQTARYICDSGLSGTGYARALLELDQLLGRRRVLAGSASLLPLAPGTALLPHFRHVFGSEPLDPAVATWWLEPHQNAYPRGTPHRPLRAILGRRALESPLGPVMARSLLEVIARPEGEVALTERELGPVNALAVDGSYALLEDLPGEPETDCCAALWLAGQQRVAPLDHLIDSLWDGLPPHEKDPTAVAEALRRAARA